MLELDANCIDYSAPPTTTSEGSGAYDASRVMTVKELLMFAVQISVGLEYLSAKGFVHRYFFCSYFHAAGCRAKGLPSNERKKI